VRKRGRGSGTGCAAIESYPELPVFGQADELQRGSYSARGKLQSSRRLKANCSAQSRYCVRHLEKIVSTYQKGEPHPEVLRWTKSIPDYRRSYSPAQRSSLIEPPVPTRPIDFTHEQVEFDRHSGV